MAKKLLLTMTLLMSLSVPAMACNVYFPHITWSEHAKVDGVARDSSSMTKMTAPKSAK